MMGLSVVSLHCSLVNLLHVHFKNDIFSNIRAHVTPHTKIIFHPTGKPSTEIPMNGANTTEKNPHSVGGWINSTQRSLFSFIICR